MVEDWERDYQHALYEDELPDDHPYDEMYPYSWVDVVRMFPSEEFANGYMACLKEKEV